jgi:hypothetical protein
LDDLCSCEGGLRKGNEAHCSAQQQYEQQNKQFFLFHASPSLLSKPYIMKLLTGLAEQNKKSFEQRGEPTTSTPDSPVPDWYKADINAHRILDRYVRRGTINSKFALPSSATTFLKKSQSLQESIRAANSPMGAFPAEGICHSPTDSSAVLPEIQGIQ